MPAKSPSHDVSPAQLAGGPGSDRTFGLFFAAVFGVAGAWLAWTGRTPAGAACVAIAAALACLAIVSPARLHRANRGWFALGMLLARIVNPVVIGAMFFLVITPVGLLMRAFGQRPLSLRFEPARASYWIERNPRGPAAASMRDQF